MLRDKKNAFDKIRSTVERRHLLQKALEEKSAFICKFDEEDELVQFIPVDFQEGVLLGRAGSTPKMQGKGSGIGNFSVGQDRYFFSGDVTIEGAGIALPERTDIFKLERRKTMRVPVPEDYPFSVRITQIDGRAALRECVTVDVSAGGVRIYFPLYRQGEGLAQGGLVKGSLHMPSTKVLDFDGEVKHVQMQPIADGEALHFGIEFGQCREALFQRMTTLTFDIQRKLTRDY